MTKKDEMLPPPPDDPSNIADPAPPRERTTTRPPPEPPITEAQAVELFHRQFAKEMAPMRLMVKELHELLAGRVGPDGVPVGGFARAIHGINNNLTAIRASTDGGVGEAGSYLNLPDLIAERVATKVTNGVLHLFQTEIQKLHSRHDELRGRIDKLAIRISANGESHAEPEEA